MPLLHTVKLDDPSPQSLSTSQDPRSQVTEISRLYLVWL